MSNEDRHRWDEKWRSRAGADTAPDWLVGHQALLVGGGIAVDLATGRGACARFLARHGFQVVGVDISFVALRQADALARASSLETLRFVQGDLDSWSLPPHSVDVVTVFRYLDRDLFPMIQNALRPGGLLFYETRTIGWLEREPTANPDFLLQRGELLRLSAGMVVAAYLESRHYASLIARQR